MIIGQGGSKGQDLEVNLRRFTFQNKVNHKLYIEREKAFTAWLFRQ